MMDPLESAKAEVRDRNAYCAGLQWAAKAARDARADYLADEISRKAEKVNFDKLKLVERIAEVEAKREAERSRFV